MLNIDHTYVVYPSLYHGDSSIWTWKRIQKTTCTSLSVFLSKMLHTHTNAHTQSHTHIISLDSNCHHVFKLWPLYDLYMTLKSKKTIKLLYFLIFWQNLIILTHFNQLLLVRRFTQKVFTVCDSRLLSKIKTISCPIVWKDNSYYFQQGVWVFVTSITVLVSYNHHKNE